MCHGSVLLLEPVTQPLGRLHVLVHASHDAALLSRGKGLALEAVDAVVETPLDEIGVHLVPDRSAMEPSIEVARRDLPIFIASRIY